LLSWTNQLGGVGQKRLAKHNQHQRCSLDMQCDHTRPRHLHDELLLAAMTCKINFYSIAVAAVVVIVILETVFYLQ
jgi:hypothetical protein